MSKENDMSSERTKQQDKKNTKRKTEETSMTPDSHKASGNAGSSSDSAKRKLSFSNDEKNQATAHSTKNDDVEGITEGINRLDVSKDTKNKWVQDYPWQDKKPRDYLKQKFDNMISCSKKHPVGNRWKTNGKIDLNKVYDDLPNFIQKNGAESSLYHELEKVIEMLQTSPSEKAQDIERKMKNEASLPLTREIIDKKSGNTPKQKKSRKGEEYTAQSISEPAVEKRYHMKNLDVNGCVLKVRVPQHKMKFFIERSGFVYASLNSRSRRWVFIPSYMRANCGLFDWSQAGVDEEVTIRIIVVRPSEFEEYVKHVRNHLPIISLPNNEIGIGYARYWILKIATSLRLQYIWMIDDDVKQFYEYHPGRKPKGNKYDERRRRFDDVFTKFESIVKENKRKKLAAISPVNYHSKRNSAWATAFMQNPVKVKAFTRKPSRVAVFLNLKLINEKGVCYRPQLVRFEDMLFGKECEVNNLKVLVWNRIQVYSMTTWSKTGCHAAVGGGGGENGGGGGEGEGGGLE